MKPCSGCDARSMNSQCRRIHRPHTVAIARLRTTQRPGERRSGLDASMGERSEPGGPDRSAAESKGRRLVVFAGTVGAAGSVARPGEGTPSVEAAHTLSKVIAAKTSTQKDGTPKSIANPERGSFLIPETIAHTTDATQPTETPITNGIMNPTPIQSLSCWGLSSPTTIPAAVDSNGAKSAPNHHRVVTAGCFPQSTPPVCSGFTRYIWIARPTQQVVLRIPF